ncbi:MAG TPA: fructosamine kinase family protein [Saprospiraceae bacterium]|nr:fructosamine kinase family protein [Saprospiraceae bacterium]
MIDFVTVLNRHLSHPVSNVYTAPVMGGDINQSFLVIANKTKYFVKVNNDPSSAAMFMSELNGLKTLDNTKSIRVPHMIGKGELGSYSYLILEWIENQMKDDVFWEHLGRDLARLHETRHEKFGLDEDNFIGGLPQCNEWKEKWVDFFLENRIEPLVKMARDEGLISSDVCHKFEKCSIRLIDIMPLENPSLVHGDLWSGNIMCNNSSENVFIDPAVYYGHREMDIAMTVLFGGFSPIFYDSYQEYFPMMSGWQDRLRYYNLYPLLVHLNLFGMEYLPRIKDILSSLE